MVEKSNIIHSVIKSLLIIILGLPSCLLILLISLIVFLSYGYSLCLTIGGLFTHVWMEYTFGEEQYRDLLVSGMFFAIGSLMIWASSTLLRLMLKGYRRSFFGRIPQEF